MNRNVAWRLLACSIFLGFLQPARAVTIPTVPIGNPGHAADASTGFGGVANAYNIGTTEVTVGQYTAFLNAVAATDQYGLYNPAMATDLNVAGIARSGASGSYTYNVSGSSNHPISYVSWGDAARFANWLNNGQQPGPEDATTTEDGAYTLNGALTDGALMAATRNAGATWVVPSEDEWYKAAYYDPNAGHYWQYPTGTNTPPTSAPPGSTPNTANYTGPSSGYAVTGSTTYSSSQNFLTDVGAYGAAASPYGTFDQGGNVWEWNESPFAGNRGLRGGAWENSIVTVMFSGNRSSGAPTFEAENVGFRVANVPEPGTAALLAVACLSLVWWKKRLR